MVPIPESSASYVDIEPKVKPKRRRAKQDGTPQLQFVTATDPSQFKDEKAKRSVRSQAMRHYRNGWDKQVKKKQDGTEPAPKAQTSALEEVSQAGPRNSSSRPGHFHFGGLEPYTGVRASAPSTFGNGFMGTDSLFPSYAVWQDTNASCSKSMDGESCASARRGSPVESENNDKTLTIRPRVLEYELSDDHETSQMYKFVRTVTPHLIGNDIDPFKAMLQFKNPKLDNVHLTRQLMRAFGSEAMLREWVPIVAMDPQFMLSSGVLASLWLDMVSGCSGDSKRTAMIKAEMFEWAQERMLSPELYLDDYTIYLILHLLASESWNVDEKTMRIHYSAICRIISLRGGISTLPLGPGRDMALAGPFHCNLVCETPRHEVFADWRPPALPLETDGPAVPESPLYCPEGKFRTISADPQCRDLTHQLLCDMRSLTDLFIGFFVKPNVPFDATQTNSAPTHCLSKAGYDYKISQICSRVAALPSARDPSSPIHNDWVFESCRITALIYTASLTMRVPFSTAADPDRNVLLFDPQVAATVSDEEDLTPRRLNELLYEALGKTDTANVWGNMVGVFYWVTTIGAAASRTPLTTSNPQRVLFRNEQYALWVRRCFVLISLRTFVITIFEHPVPTLSAQKTLLDVQEVLLLSSSTKPFQLLL